VNEREPLAIRFGTLHDQTGDPKRDGTLFITNGLVERVAGPDEPVPGGTRIIEAACAIPGLINAHAHLEASGEPQITSVFLLLTPTQRALVCVANARKALYAGVTSMRDLGSTDSLAIDTRDAIASGSIPGPNIVAAGRAICTTCVKFIATGGVLTKGAVPGIEQLCEDELRAGIEEAHKHGMRCAAHAIGAGGIKNALRAGIDSIEHGHLIDDEGIALLVERGAYLVPTLAAIRCIVDTGDDAGMPDYVLRKAREIAAHAEGNLRRARAAGAKFAGGSDAGTPFNFHDGYAYELELMQSMLGMSAREALRAATVESAKLLGLERGTLAMGDVADIVLLASDIDEDPRAFRTPSAVLKDGAIVVERR
jgi:imidazolonepropionase-like amidohydrolase